MPEYLAQTNTDIPKLKDEDLYNLVAAAKVSLSQEPTLLRLTGDFVIVGDLHGNLRDLLRIIATNGIPPSRKYIFLGDYVDRGDFSVEVLTLLFSFKLIYPECIYMIRGNHEFEQTNSVYGFKNQVLEVYDEAMYNHFNECFAYLPLAGILNDTFFLVRGGISPLLNYVKEIEVIPRPIYSCFEQYSKSFVPDLLWSDPGEAEITFLKNYRGFGYLFGALAAHTFLKQNNLKHIIRSHQCVNAIQNSFNGCVMTVFSSSCYSHSTRNTMGVIEIFGTSMKPIKYDALEQIKKDFVTYRFVDLTERMPYTFNKHFTSPLKPQCRPRRATVGELIKANRRSSTDITQTSAFPRLILTQTQKSKRNSVNIPSGHMVIPPLPGSLLA
ncbi:Ser/Thr protein phosphatase, putative [Trichomonas vaginalis G3]|uniref:Serine/threonine-protein phosphatase n=1 Tax=Trichomonas vaginalis (strain ATCC PRA-98 / G3) TaxID=412133 RepID=A2FGP7_TRIV3|nr:phosphoprotein phosphatase protein [Trichomonas vaginalis G3]EAX95929.1 Ser/Thr protein phosphatase, putative [Trichomonas vaginalis G3]KAI5540141.1 phosphoprotein phosphatase protein [Trichomonas vaginalis G3]|eukprot:XP_001308859.1 Ser/Thr protein phosphatase [Trichomonas vaginalis G3]